MPNAPNADRQNPRNGERLPNALQGKHRQVQKNRKPACYEPYGRNCCLGKPTRAGTVAARCQRCKWLEKEENP